MKNADESTPTRNSLPDDPDLGPEPDWLLDDDLQDEGGSSAVPGAQPRPSFGPAPGERAVTDEQEPSETSEVAIDAGPAPAPARSGTDSPDVEKKEHPWLWGVVPLVALLATALIAWFSTTQTLNDIGTWEAVRIQQPPLLPARWAMMTWWLVVPLMAVFLLYGTIPAGRQVTRIKVTGPLITIGLAAMCVWIFAQHWQWDAVALTSIGIAALVLIVTYVLVALGPHIKNIRQRMLAVIPLSAALGYSVMLTILTWQGYSAQPFGERGSSVLFALLLVIIAAIFAFFLRDGLFALVLAIWFAGVVHQQWGHDALISLVAAVGVLLTGALAGLGTILATESHRPSLTTSVENRRGRTSFFRKSDNSSTE